MSEMKQSAEVREANGSLISVEKFLVRCIDTTDDGHEELAILMGTPKNQFYMSISTYLAFEQYIPIDRNGELLSEIVRGAEMSEDGKYYIREDGMKRFCEDLRSILNGTGKDVMTEVEETNSIVRLISQLEKELGREDSSKEKGYSVTYSITVE